MIVILTGAGISQESGLATFRDAGGIWQKVSMDDVATPRGFARNPELSHEFHNSIRRQITGGSVLPNAAHKALARLERESAVPVLVVTQNVDNLHELAGSRALLHMHGEILKTRCLKCGEVFFWDKDLSRDEPCPGCAGSDCLRPDIVWFEEIPMHMDEIEAALARCTIFVSIGTSGNVYPAAGFSRVARSHGAHLVELNLEPSVGATVFHTAKYGPAGKVVPEWVDEVLATQSK